jgi:hypothetical protein
MRFKDARHRAGEAIGNMVDTPLAAGRKLDWPAIKRGGIVLGAGLALAFLTGHLDRKVRGSWPLICGIAAMMVAFADYHRHDKRMLLAVVGTWPMVLLLAFALTATPATRQHTRTTTRAATEASIVGADRAVKGLGQLGTWGSSELLPWLVVKAKDGIGDVVRMVTR